MEKSNENSYVLKEAELIVANYVSKIEEKEKNKKTNVKFNSNLKRKYSILKKYSIISTLILIISIIMHFV